MYFKNTDEANYKDEIIKPLNLCAIKIIYVLLN